VQANRRGNRPILKIVAIVRKKMTFTPEEKR